jgi:hypothetical protein
LWNPSEWQEEKFSAVLEKGVGMQVVAISSRQTRFPTIRIPDGGDLAPWVQLASGWNLLVEVGLSAGIDLDKPVRARKGRQRVCRLTPSISPESPEAGFSPLPTGPSEPLSTAPAGERFTASNSYPPVMTGRALKASGGGRLAPSLCFSVMILSIPIPRYVGIDPVRSGDESSFPTMTESSMARTGGTGNHFELPRNDAETGDAIHGFLYRAPCASHAEGTGMRLSAVLPARPGYPFPLSVEIIPRLAPSVFGDDRFDPQ